MDADELKKHLETIPTNDIEALRKKPAAPKSDMVEYVKDGEQVTPFPLHEKILHKDGEEIKLHLVSAKELADIELNEKKKGKRKKLVPNITVDLSHLARARKLILEEIASLQEKVKTLKETVVGVEDLMIKRDDCKVEIAMRRQAEYLEATGKKSMTVSEMTVALNGNISRKEEPFATLKLTAAQLAVVEVALYEMKFDVWDMFKEEHESLLKKVTKANEHIDRNN